MSKMYLWVLTLVTLFEPTLVGQFSHSFLITYIFEVASNSIALWLKVICAWLPNESGECLKRMNICNPSKLLQNTYYKL
jgi:hypothetical protein